MPSWKVPLADVTLSEEEISLVADTLRSGWLSMGPQTERLEAEFATYTGAPHAIAVANGTAALHLICQAAGFGPGDEVIVPSLTFVATANAVAYTGATPVFADIAGVDRPWLSAAACEAFLTPRTAGILNMTYGGHSGETDALVKLAARHGLQLLEDAAHGAGTRLRGRHVGRFGSAGAFSFFSNKNLAVGEGGMVISEQEELASRVRLLRSHGMTTLSWQRHRGHAASYDVVALGYNYRIDEPRATLARARLHRLDAENAQRRALDGRYRELLAPLEGLALLAPPGPELESAHHLFTIVLDEDRSREQFRRDLAAAGVQTSVHYPPAHRFSIYEAQAAELPVTEAFAERVVTLPMFAHMSCEQQDLVVEACAAALT